MDIQDYYNVLIAQEFSILEYLTKVSILYLLRFTTD